MKKPVVAYMLIPHGAQWRVIVYGGGGVHLYTEDGERAAILKNADAFMRARANAETSELLQ